MLQALIIRREILVDRFYCPFGKSHNREKRDCWPYCDKDAQNGCELLAQKLKAVEDKLLELTEIFMEDNTIIDFKVKKYSLKEGTSW